MTTVERGVHTHRLQLLSEVLWEWISVIERTVRLWPDDDDSAWIYNERASLSIFAGAVWRSGGIAFEEYIAEKYVNNHRGKQEVGGRSDLFFQIGRREFIAEAKQSWPKLTSRTNFRGFVSKSLTMARAEVKRARKYDYERLGMVFAVPAIPIGLGKDAEVLLDMWLKEIREVKYCAHAWSFPPEARRKSDGKFYYPGISFLISQVD